MAGHRPTRAGGPTRPRGLLDHGHRLDLDEGAGNGEAGDLHQRARRRVGAEELLPHLAVAFAVADVRHEYRNLHHVAEAGAARLENAAHVLEDPASLRADVVRPDELAVFVEG